MAVRLSALLVSQEDLHVDRIDEQQDANDKDSNTDVTCKFTYELIVRVLNVGHDTNAQIISPPPLEGNRKKYYLYLRL
jgi:hypothetical protein